MEKYALVVAHIQDKTFNATVKPLAETIELNETDLDLENEVVGIVSHPKEPPVKLVNGAVSLEYLPVYNLVKV